MQSATLCVRLYVQKLTLRAPYCIAKNTALVVEDEAIYSLIGKNNFDDFDWASSSRCGSPPKRLPRANEVSASE